MVADSWGRGEELASYFFSAAAERPAGARRWIANSRTPPHPSDQQHWSCAPSKWHLLAPPPTQRSPARARRQKLVKRKAFRAFDMSQNQESLRKSSFSPSQPSPRLSQPSQPGLSPLSPLLSPPIAGVRVLSRAGRLQIAGGGLKS